MASSRRGPGKRSAACFNARRHPLETATAAFPETRKGIETTRAADRESFFSSSSFPRRSFCLSSNRDKHPASGIRQPRSCQVALGFFAVFIYFWHDSVICVALHADILKQMQRGESDLSMARVVVSVSSGEVGGREW